MSPFGPLPPARGGLGGGQGRRGRTFTEPSALLVAIVLLALAAILPMTVRAQAGQDPFAVEGTIRNGTTDGAVPTDLPIRLVGVLPDGTANTWEGVADSEGRFRLEGVGRLDGATYVLGVEYGGATYVERVEPAGRGGTASRDLLIFEPSLTDPGIRFEQSAIVLVSADEAQRTMTVLEVHTVVNPTDRTFTPRSDGPGGPAGLLVFGLPPNASDVTPEFGLNAAFLVQIDRGFASLNPLFPGRTELGFRYRLPYGDQQFQFSRSIRYPVQSFQVLVATEGLTVDSAQLVPAEVASVGGRQMKRHNGGPFAPGSSVSFSIDGLPLPGGPLARIPPVAVAVAGVCIGLLAITGGWAYGRGADRGGTKTRDLAEIADEVVALDLALADGRIDGEAHRREREALVGGVRGLG